MPKHFYKKIKTKTALSGRYIRYKVRQYMQKTSEKVVVQTSYGPIRGVKRISFLGDEFYCFEKIPFAKPPLRELRFKDPQPPTPWTRVVDCTKEGSVPVQINLLLNRFEGVEDCLYLNVYTRNLNPPEPLPVMVWLYGGGFVSGGATKDMYSPDYFMRKDVVFIALNYRVGAFGFLSLKDPSLQVPGNAGLKDQTLGLKWVKQNCIKFGGDPNNITLFGESAGGASTHYQMISNQAKGLFHKAVLMSGCSVTNWATVPPNDWAYRTAKTIGYKGENNEENVLKFLRSAKCSDIAFATQEKLMNDEELKNRVLFPFGPVIEPYITEQCIIDKEPLLMMRDAWSKDIPLVIGGCSFEGLFAYPALKKKPKIIAELGDCEYLVPLEVNPDRTSAQCKELGLKIKKAHFGDKEPSEKTITEYMEVFSYKFFWHGLHRTILSRLKYATAPTYLYRFDFDSPEHNHVRILICGRKVRGTCHADDLSYIFVNALTTKLPKDSKEYKTMERMTGLLTNFASTGNPNCDEIKSITWEPVKHDEKPFKCLNIADDIEIRDLPEAKLLEVWDSLYPKELLI